MAYLSVISNPDDSVSLERIINVPKRGLGNTSVAKLQDYARGQGDLAVRSALGGRRGRPYGCREKACRGLLDLFEGLRVAAVEVSPTESIGAVLDESGYRKELEAEDTVEAESRLENLEELINASREYERVEPEPTLDGFLQEQALYSDQDSLTSEGGRVTLMTLHNAKGLEFSPRLRRRDGGGDFPARPFARRTQPRRGTEARLRRHHARQGDAHAHPRQAALQLGRARVQDAIALPLRDPRRVQVGHGTRFSKRLGPRRMGRRSVRAWRVRESSSGGVAYRAGERVRHTKFGVGEVVEAGVGKVVIRFGTEERTFVPEIAPLSRVT